MASEQQLKERAIGYYRAKAATYTERYSIEASGDLLWTRHAAILDFVRSWEVSPGLRVLDMGCGPGVLTRELARMGFYGTGVDASPAMVEICRREAESAGISDRWNYLEGDVEALPVADASIDVAICSGVIDYLPSDDKLIAEAARVLKPGARFVLCFTNKFGYAISLSTPLYWLKKIPWVRSFASLVRAKMVGGKEGVMTFDFLPRKQVPSAARRSMRSKGFEVEADRYVHYSLLPAPLCTLTSKVNFGIDEKLGILDKSPLRGLGSCYIVSGRLSHQ